MSVESEQEFLDQFAGQDQAQDDASQNTDTGQENNQVNDDGEQQAEHDFTPSEQKAYDQGWRPEEEFEGEPDNWKTAKEYNRDGEWLAKLKDERIRTDQIKKDFDDRLEQSNKLHEARRRQELDNLKTAQRNAVDMADTDAYDTATRQIDEFEQQSLPVAKPQQKEIDPQIKSWVDNNQWINDPNDDRTLVAMGALQQFQQQNPNASIPEAIAFVEERVNRIRHAGNARRNQPNTTENNRRSPQRRSRELTMNDLTSTEKSEWKQFGQTMFKTEGAFLKAVKDARVK